MTVLDAIKYRTSYRGEYQNTPVPKEDLRTIMEAGLAAPSGCNAQTTSLIAVDDADLLHRLREAIGVPIAETAPAVICVLTQAVVVYRGKRYNIQDYSAAIENMLLAAVALGYQSCWYEGHIADTDDRGKRIAEILGVPDDYELVCLLPIGTALAPLKHVSKRSFEDRAWFNGFKV